MATATTTDWLRAKAQGNTIGVDREAGIIHGYVVAQEGPFKSEGRGEFDKKALKAIVKLMKTTPNGLKSRFAHPSLSDDGIGKFLGRSKNPRMGEIDAVNSDGEKVPVVRADLHLDPSSRNTPSGDLGGYVMDLAKSDPDAMSSSLVLEADQEYRLDSKGRPKLDAEGNELPPLWFPTRLHASDVVDTGDAVDGFLSVEGLPDEVVRRGAALLDQQFPGASREAIEARCVAWLSRYLSYRFGETDSATPEDLEAIAEYKGAFAAIHLNARKLRILTKVATELAEDAGECAEAEMAGVEVVGYASFRDAEKEIIRRRNRERQNAKPT